MLWGSQDEQDLLTRKIFSPLLHSNGNILRTRESHHGKNWIPLCYKALRFGERSLSRPPSLWPFPCSGQLGLSPMASRSPPERVNTARFQRLWRIKSPFVITVSLLRCCLELSQHIHTPKAQGFILAP